MGKNSPSATVLTETAFDLPDLMGTAAARRREAPWALPRMTARWEATPTEEEREKADIIGIGCVVWE